MKKIASIALTIAIGIAIPGISARKADANNVLSRTITDESIIFPESFEQDTQKLLEGWFLKNYTATDMKYDTEADVPVSDAEIERRLAALPTIIEMPYNQIVRSYIDRYTGQGRKQVAAMLGLSLYYMPIFEQALESRGLPLELKYLPVIESGLDPNATSRHGAAGLWQFMLNPAKGLGMEVNSLVDMRRDPYTSSAKAADFLKQLYDTYGDWSLAIAAYNCGPSTVNKAIRRAGGDASKQDFWSIYQYLPAETRGYVPAFIAANYVMNYHRNHRISPVLPTKPLVTDTIGITDRIHFDQISKVLNIPVEELRMLNPQFRADLIPASAQTPYMLTLPSQQVHAYIMSEAQIKGYNADQYARRTNVAVGDADVAMVEPATAEVENNEPIVTEEAAPAPETKPAARPAVKTRTVTHKVTAGQSINDVAALYEVTPSQIRQWNGLRRNAVRPGQQLRIETTVSETAIAANTAPAVSTPAPAATAKPAATQQAATPAKPGNKTTAAKTEEPAKSTKPSGKYDSKADSKTDSKADAKADAKTDSKSKSKYGKNNKDNQDSADNADKNSKYGKNNKYGKNSKTGKNSKKKEPAKPTSHSVKSGDNLSDIAKEHGTTVEAIRKANPDLKGDMLHPGDKLNLPKDKKGTSKSSKSGKSGKGKSSKKKR